MHHSRNLDRHKNSEFLFGHFSSVDKFDFKKFPKLEFTNPIKFKLEKGESIYIPKGWWHWIKSTEKSFAINYWFNNQNNSNPFVFDYYIKYDTNLFDDQEIYVWDSYNDNISDNYVSLFQDFFNHLKRF